MTEPSHLPADGTRGAHCTCPVLVDVFRGRAAETKDPCPVHDSPAGHIDVFVVPALPMCQPIVGLPGFDRAWPMRPTSRR